MTRRSDSSYGADHDLIAAAVSVLEAERIEATEHTPLNVVVDGMRAELDPKFQEVWDRAHKREYWRTGRRRGKSHYCIRKIIAAAAMAPYSVNPYILPTAKAANLVVWPLLKRIALRHFPETKFDETLKTAVLPVGGTIVLGGCETKSDVGKWFGMAFAQAIVDECGNFPDQVLKDLSEEAIEPALMDHDGALVHSGNPGRVLHGLWYEQTKDGDRDDKTPLYVADARDNPFLKIPAAVYFEQVLERHGWQWDNPTFRRQYLGQWVSDGTGLIFRLTEQNLVRGLPTHTKEGSALAPRLWRHCLGIDVGYTEDMALSLLAAHPHDVRTVCRRVEKHQNMLIAQLAERVRFYKAYYPRLQVVIDAGGMGKSHAAELAMRFQIYAEPAKKDEKLSEIVILRDDIASARFVLEEGPETDPLREEFSALVWNEDEDGWEDGPPDHATDATVYAKRKLRHHILHSATPEIPKTKDQLMAEEYERLKAAAQKRADEAARQRSPAVAAHKLVATRGLF